MVRRCAVRVILGVLAAGLILALLLPAVFSDHAAAGDDISVSAALARSATTVHTPVLLRVTVRGARDAELDVPEVDNLVFHRQGQSTRIEMSNGSFTSSITFTFAVEALREGEYAIPPFAAKIKGKQYRTEAIPLVVRAAGGQRGEAPGAPGASRQENGNREADGPANAFLTVEGMQKTAYVGETMPIVIKAYFRRGLRAEITSLPELRGDGFVMTPLTNEPQQTTESHQGIPYAVLTWRGTVTPIREGTSAFGLLLDAVLYLPQGQEARSRRDPFFDDDFFQDDLFDRFFGRTSRQERTLQSAAHSVAVRSLPEKGRPEDFSGAVGDFAFSVAAAPDRVKIGEPVTLTMTISGTGNFDRVNEPRFPAGAAWKTYPPSSAFSRQGNGSTGKKTFERAIVPLSSELTEIPALQFSYFDPRQEAYITLAAEPLPIAVDAEPDGKATAPGQSAAAMPAERENDKPAPAAGVRMRHDPGRFVHAITPLYQRSWFIALALVCTALLVGLAVIGLMRRRRVNGAGKRQRRRLEKETAAILAALAQAHDAGDDRRFLQLARALLQNRLALRWQRRPEAITALDLRRRLGPDSPLAVIMTQAEQQAYGGLQLDREEMGRYLETLKKELGKLP